MKSFRMSQKLKTLSDYERINSYHDKITQTLKNASNFQEQVLKGQYEK